MFMSISRAAQAMVSATVRLFSFRLEGGGPGNWTDARLPIWHRTVVRITAAVVALISKTERAKLLWSAF
jgi:hypothetical protein